MEWRVSPVQGKKLYKVTVDSGGMAAFPEETRKNTNMLSTTHLCHLPF